MDFDLYQFHEGIKKDGVLFCYSGPISQATVEGIGVTLRLNMEIAEAGGYTTQNVFLVFVEQMQNILNYSEEWLTSELDADKELRKGILVISQAEGYFHVYCGNRILNKDMDVFRNRIESVRLLGKEELKALYKERRKGEREPGSKGAGLGLIDMARRSGKPMEYQFTKIDDTYSFFSIRVSVEDRT